MKASFDQHNVLRFENGLSPDEVADLDEMLTEAFNSGLRSGYRQGREAATNDSTSTS